MEFTSIIDQIILSEFDIINDFYLLNDKYFEILIGSIKKEMGKHSDINDYHNKFLIETLIKFKRKLKGIIKGKMDKNVTGNHMIFKTLNGMPKCLWDELFYSKIKPGLDELFSRVRKHMSEAPPVKTTHEEQKQPATSYYTDIGSLLISQIIPV